VESCYEFGIETSGSIKCWESPKNLGPLVVHSSIELVS
jgi:hypothetical protein